MTLEALIDRDTNRRSIKPIVMRESRTDNFISKAVIDELAEQAKNPPGGDIYISTFYEALLRLIENDDSLVSGVIAEALNKKEFSPKHFVNLLFRAIQYLKLDNSNPEYPNAFSQPDIWEKELPVLFSSQSEQIKTILETKHTATTIYQRYAGPKTILSRLFNSENDGLVVADFGCGGNYGLPGIAQDEPFKPIADHTPSQLVTRYLSKPVKISEGLAIDKENPKDPEVRRWRHACSFYPSELGQLQEILDLESRLDKAGSIRFLQRDLLDLLINGKEGEMPRSHFDAVIMSTLLYQMHPYEQKVVLEKAKSILNPERGVIIAQDFAVKNKDNPQGLNFDIEWFANPFTYRTFISNESTGWQMREVLQWSNGRCMEVRAGEDFSLIQE